MTMGAFSSMAAGGGRGGVMLRFSVVPAILMLSASLSGAFLASGFDIHPMVAFRFVFGVKIAYDSQSLNFPRI